MPEEIYTKEEIIEALRKTFHSENMVLGVRIILKPEDGLWFQSLCKDFFENLKHSTSTSGGSSGINMLGEKK
jgi:hypothetical protein